MGAARIAFRYAKPLLELAEEKKVLEDVKSDLQNFSDLCQSNRDLVLTLKSPIIPHLKKAQILQLVFKGKVNNLTSSFFEIVTKKNREDLLPDIAHQFLTLYNEKLGFQEATVTTTLELDEGARQSFKKLVTDISGKKPILQEHVDPDLIGGYVLSLGDRQIDDSVSGKLKDLKLKFQKENS